MKLKLHVLILVLVISTVHAEMTGHWKLDTIEDDKIKDVVGFNDGTIANASLTDGVIHKALDINRQSLVRIGDLGSSKQASLAFWVNIYGSETNNNGKNSVDIINAEGVVVRYHNRAFNTVLNSRQSDANQLTGHRLRVSTWFNVVVVMDCEKGQMQLYVNGGLAEDTESIKAVIRSINFNSLTIGSKNNATSRYHFKIDDLRIYDHALSYSEIEALYDKQDWRNAQETWPAKILDSSPGLGYCDTYQVLPMNDSLWFCFYPSGSSEVLTDQNIYFKKSYNQGRTWVGPDVFERANEIPCIGYQMAYKNPFNNRIFVFFRYNVNNAASNRIDSIGEIYFRYSDDYGDTWSERIHVPTRRTAIDHPTAPLGGWFFGQGPIHVGEQFYLPVNKLSVNGENRVNFGHTEAWYYVSPDLLTIRDPKKATWMNYPTGDKGVNLQGSQIGEEHSTVQLSNGTLYMVFRSDQGYLGESFSTDRGKTWIEGQPAEYWQGNKVMAPRGGPGMKKLSDGTYILAFHNDFFHAFGSSYPYGSRTPLWLTVGWEDGNRLKFAQPEIVLYNDRTIFGSAEKNRRSLYCPYFFEDVGRVFMAIDYKKTDLQIHEIPQWMIEDLKNQRENKTITTNNLRVWLDAADFNKPPQITAHSPTTIAGESKNLTVQGDDRYFDFSDSEASITLNGKNQMLQFEHLDKDGSFSIELFCYFETIDSEIALFDSRNNKGVGVVISTGPKGSVKSQISSTNGYTYTGHSAEQVLHAKMWHYIVVTWDGASDIVTFIVDGILSKREETNTNEFPHEIGDMNSQSMFYIGHPANSFGNMKSFDGRIRMIRLYNKALTTSQAISNFNSIMQN